MKGAGPDGRRGQEVSTLRALAKMISFSNLTDPATARVVAPSDEAFAEAFGAGYRLKGFTIEMVPVGIWPLSWLGLSGVPITRNIQRNLPWWGQPGRPAMKAWRAWLKGSNQGVAVGPESLFSR